MDPSTGITRCCVPDGVQIAAPMGISSAMVPQDVPVANPRKEATRNVMAGRTNTGKLLLLTRFPTKPPVLRYSTLQIPPMDQARINMVNAGTMDLMPSVIPSIKERKEITRLGTNRKNAATNAIKLPRTRDREESQFPKDSVKLQPPPKAPPV